MASDAFFPFADNVDNAAAAGIAAIVQPGGSKKDDEVIAAADSTASPWSSPANATSSTTRPLIACVAGENPGGMTRRLFK